MAPAKQTQRRMQPAQVVQHFLCGGRQIGQQVPGHPAAHHASAHRVEGDDLRRIRQLCREQQRLLLLAIHERPVPERCSQHVGLPGVGETEVAVAVATFEVAKATEVLDPPAGHELADPAQQLRYAGQSVRV